MKTIKHLALFLILALPTVMQAEDYTYTTNNGTITITHYTGADGTVVIPDTINGLPVTSIGRHAFSSELKGNGVTMTIPNTKLTCVIIPEGIRSIGDKAFYSCVGLLGSKFQIVSPLSEAMHLGAALA